MSELFDKYSRTWPLGILAIVWIFFIIPRALICFVIFLILPMERSELTGFRKKLDGLSEFVGFEDHGCYY